VKVFVCVCVCVCFLFAGVELIKLTQKEKEFQVYCSRKSIKQTSKQAQKRTLIILAFGGGVVLLYGSGVCLKE
jgi:amino acid permease